MIVTIALAHRILSAALPGLINAQGRNLLGEALAWRMVT